MNWKEPIKAVLRKLYERKLLRGLERIGQVSLEDLRDPDFVAGLIRQIGLRHDRRGIYGLDNRHMNKFGPGLWQIPDQLAGALVFLSQHPIKSVLEVGTCDGWTASVMAAYLRRFNPQLRFVTVDIAGRFSAHARVNTLVPIEYRGTASAEDFQNEQFDLVFIDGNHDYDGVAGDYDLVGRSARLCMFHDIIDSCRVGEENVPKFWKDLKAAEANAAEFREFTGEPEGVMGIGVRRRVE